MELQIERMNILALQLLRQLRGYAAEHQFTVAVFYVNTLEQLQADMQTADPCGSPTVNQNSESARKHTGNPFIRHLFRVVIESYSHISVAMHRVYGALPAVGARVIQASFSLIMMDGHCLKINKYTIGEHA